MKTLKSLFLGLALLVITNVVKADEPAAIITRNQAISTYINAMTQGNNAGLSEVIDQSAKFSILRGKSVISFDKADLMKFADQNQSVKQACTTTATEIESNADMSVVRVDMKFENFTRSNYVTMANTEDGWKITNVYSVFK